MLVLSRRERQRIRVGDSIVLTIVRVTGDRVRLGIEAPEDMLVLRDELAPHSIQSVPAEVPQESPVKLASDPPEAMAVAKQPAKQVALLESS